MTSASSNHSERLLSSVFWFQRLATLVQKACASLQGHAQKSSRKKFLEKYFFTLILITRSHCNLPRFFRNAPLRSMRISSRTRPKRKATYGPQTGFLGKELSRPSWDETIIKICDVETDVHVNCEEEGAENKVLWQDKLVVKKKTKITWCSIVSNFID